MAVGVFVSCVLLGAAAAAAAPAALPVNNGAAPTNKPAVFSVFWDVGSMDSCLEKAHEGHPCRVDHHVNLSEFGILPWTKALTGSIQSFPMLQGDGLPYSAGVPQAANFTRQMELIESMVEAWIPEANYSGLAIFDYEEWIPVWESNWECRGCTLAQMPRCCQCWNCTGCPTFTQHPLGMQDCRYQAWSIELVRRQHPQWELSQLVAQASKDFNAASIALFTGALQTARRLRPTATWGFYNMLGDQNGAVDAITAAAMPIFCESQMIFPSVYMNTEYNDTQEARIIHARVNASVQIAATVGARLNAPAPPVIPFVMQMKDSSQPGPLPLLSPAEIEAEFFAPYDLGASGVIVFNGNLTGDAEYWNHTRTVLGPAVRAFLDKVEACSVAHCSGNGRCVPRNSTTCVCFAGYNGPRCTEQWAVNEDGTRLKTDEGKLGDKAAEIVSVWPLPTWTTAAVPAASGSSLLPLSPASFRITAPGSLDLSKGLSECWLKDNRKNGTTCSHPRCVSGTSNHNGSVATKLKTDEGSVAAIEAQREGGHLRYMSFFGDKDCNATAATQGDGWQNLCISGNFASLKDAAEHHGMASGLSIFDAMHTLMKLDPRRWGIWLPDCPGGIKHNASCANNWNGLAARWRETIDHILAEAAEAKIRLEVVFLGDELVADSVPVQNLSSVASYIRSKVGPDVVLWCNEGITAFKCDPSKNAACFGAMPADLDMISIDYYNVFNPIAEASQTIAMYKQYILPLLGLKQRVMLVPGTVGCIPGSVCCGKHPRPVSWGQCNTSIADQDVMQTTKMRKYVEFALAEPRVAGICPWHWFDILHPDDGNEPQYALGAVSFPGLRNEIRRVGTAIIANQTPPAVNSERGRWSKPGTTGTPCQAGEGEGRDTPGTLSFNGICVPQEFPPYQNYSKAVSHPTYLQHSPSTVNITVGRQLFVDSFLIHNMSSGTAQTFHTATYHPDNPVLKPDRPWEGTYALPYSGGVFWDDEEQHIALWYRCGSVYGLGSSGTTLAPDIESTGVCLAYSKDGVHFDKPLFNDVGGPDCQNCNGTNMVRRVNFDGNTVWLDKKATDSSERYKMASVDQRENYTAYTLLQSADGRHWTIRVNRTGDISDNSRIFYNPFRERWVFSIKTSISEGVNRARAYWETPVLWQNTAWRLNGPEYWWTGSPNPHRPPTAAEKRGLYWDSPGEVKPWTWADVGDDSDPQVANPRGAYPQLNGMDTVAYESIMVGMYAIMQCLKTTAAGQPSRASDGACKGPENNERDAVFLGWSRDGWQFSRPPSPRTPFCAENSTGSMKNWNWYAVEPVAGNFIVMGDYLYFYVSGRYFTHGNRSVPNTGNGPGGAFQTCQTGLAIMRRDGFASLDAITGSTARVVTRALVWAANPGGNSYLFVNFDGRGLRVGVIDTESGGAAIAPFTLENTVRLSNDTTRSQVHWVSEAADGLASLTGRRVQLVFEWEDGSLYSFWIAHSECGESRGHLVGGGPGIGGDLDIKGECGH